MVWVKTCDGSTFIVPLLFYCKREQWQLVHSRVDWNMVVEVMSTRGPLQDSNMAWCFFFWKMEDCKATTEKKILPPIGSSWLLIMIDWNQREKKFQAGWGRRYPKLITNHVDFLEAYLSWKILVDVFSSAWHGPVQLFQIQATKRIIILSWTYLSIVVSKLGFHRAHDRW